MEGAAFSPAAAGGAALPRRGLAMTVDIDMRFGVRMRCSDDRLEFEEAQGR
jgi:hypothetical protein